MNHFTQHPTWPDYFDVQVRFDERHVKSWALDSNGDLCWYNDWRYIDEHGRQSWRNRWEVHSQIVGVTHLPDDLSWVRLIRCPEDHDGGSEGGHTHYEVWSFAVIRWMRDNPVTAYAYDGKQWHLSANYRWAAQSTFSTYVAPDPAVYDAIAAQLMRGAR